MFQHLKPTQKEGTKAQYIERYHWLKRRFCREERVKDMRPEEVTAHLILLKDSLSMSTWRHYKAATIYYLEAHSSSQDAIDALRAESSAGLPVRGAKTSGPKLKKVPVRIWNAIKAKLIEREANGYMHASRLNQVLTATLLCGLRPNEWSFSTIAHHEATGRLVLRVRNSKHTNGRANGEYRELFIDVLSETEVEQIRQAIESCRQDSDEQAEQVLRQLRDELKSVKMALMKTSRFADDPELKKVTQYSFRHQFIADAKTTFDDPVVTSALVGHRSTKTAFTHYGKRAFGTQRVRILPTPETVAAVQTVRLELYRDFVAQRGSGMGP